MHQQAGGRDRATTRITDERCTFIGHDSVHAGPHLQLYRMNHITSGDKNIWPCVAGGVVAGAACALAAVHVIPTPAMCKPSRPQGKIVLHYFPLPAMGEPVRLLLELGGFDWEDKVVDFKTWGEGALKKQAQWGQMPFMLLEDGTQFTQSRAMVKFLSNYVTVSGTPLMPSDPMVVYEADMLIDTFEDMLNKLRKTFAIEDAAQKSAAREKLFGVWRHTVPAPLPLTSSYNSDTPSVDGHCIV